MTSRIDGKVVLITGGTGSLGRALTKYLLEYRKPEKVIALGHSERGMDIFNSEIRDSRVRLWASDLENSDDLIDKFMVADTVVHAAAMKTVQYCEDNQERSTAVNVIGTQNVIRAAYRAGVEKLVFVSTDKAVNPKNKYGTDKAEAEKQIIAANVDRRQIFSCTRWGNIENSRGSVIPLFKSMKRAGVIELPLRHKNATRFAVTMPEAVAMLVRAIEGPPGLIWVKKSPSYHVRTLIEAMDCTYRLEHLTPGEKLHECLLTEAEAVRAYQNEEDIIILPEKLFNTEIDYREQIRGRLPCEGAYTSDANTFLTVEELRERMAAYD